MELRGLEWEVRVCSELGEPELEWVTVSACEEVGCMVEVASEFEGVMESASELGVLGWGMEPLSVLSWLLRFSTEVGEGWLEGEVRGLEAKSSISETATPEKKTPLGCREEMIRNKGL